MERLVDYSCSR